MDYHDCYACCLASLQMLFRSYNTNHIVDSTTITQAHYDEDTGIYYLYQDELTNYGLKYFGLNYC